MSTRLPLSDLDEEAALRTILHGTATETGEGFFTALVKNLALALDTHGAWVTEYLREKRRLRALAFWLGGTWINGYEHGIDNTPCEEVVEETRLVHIPDRVMELYEGDPDLRQVGAVSYMGVPLMGLDGTVLGHLAVLDTKPLPEEPRGLTIFQIFAARAAAELRRLRAEEKIHEREEKLGRLVSSAMDAIVELDRDLNVTLMNPAAEKLFGCEASRTAGRRFGWFVSNGDAEKLSEVVRRLDARPKGQQYLWIPGGLRARGADGKEFPAEATISRFEVWPGAFYTLILRNVNERIEAEQKIESLTVQTQYLREELRTLLNVGDIVGQSAPMIRVLRDVAQVAETDTTVLVSGETGTGKELIARAIHSASRRREKSLITVNCAAIPASLIESEFFGHEKGAFTGATQRREGRFALADGGTIFLDEVGELPLELQAKLLRVLQEGEFEPLGSAKTRKVDVRVIAATNRNLEQEVRDGNFREDLYYRLNVFPVHSPALRERPEDIPLLASVFAAKFAQREGRAIERLTHEDIRRLTAYGWPGNVRELQNVIERAVITSVDGRLNLDRALPDVAQRAPEEASAAPADSDRIYTLQELQEIERRNIVRALEASAWRVSGANGAAQRLGINPSTLNSRMKALGISRPR